MPPLFPVRSLSLPQVPQSDMYTKPNSCVVLRAGEAFVFRGVLHDWPDDKVSLVLKNCHKAMVQGGKLAETR